MPRRSCSNARTWHGAWIVSNSGCCGATSLALGVTPINLRGIGSRGSLVLVNGKRIGRSGLLGGYADLSSIPSDMVERVEIQLDGASALYGSDAVGGVVNVILRDEHVGTTVKLRRTAGLAGAFDGINALIATTKAWNSGKVTGLFGYYTTDNRVRLDDPARDYLASGNPTFVGDRLFRDSERYASRQRTYVRIALDQSLGDIDASLSLTYMPGETENTTAYRPAGNDDAEGDSLWPATFTAETELPAMVTAGNTDRLTFSGNLDGAFEALLGWEWHLGIGYSREDSRSTTESELSRDLLHDAPRQRFVRRFGGFTSRGPFPPLPARRSDIRCHQPGSSARFHGQAVLCGLARRQRRCSARTVRQAGRPSIPAPPKCPGTTRSHRGPPMH